MSFSHGQNEIKQAYFASGCFWCVESIFESLEGVNNVESGYSGGWLKKSYLQPSFNWKNRARRKCKNIIQPKSNKFSNLVEVFFASHDPTTLNRQGPDVGTHYRSIAFYEFDEEKLLNKKLKRLLENQTYPVIVTEIKKFEKFYITRKLSPRLQNKKSNNPYIWNVSVPRIEKFKSNYADLLKKIDFSANNCKK